MAAQRERVRQLGGDDAAAADRRVADDADLHRTCFSRRRCAPSARLHDDAFGQGDAGQRAELRVAALDQLPERRRGQPRRHRARLGAPRTGWRSNPSACPLALVVRRDVDHERRVGTVVDEVVADPVGAPRRLFGLVAAQAAGEGGVAEHLARGAVIRMAIVPVRDRDRSRTMPADGRHRRADQLRRSASMPPSGHSQILAPRRAEHARGGVGLDAPLRRRAVATTSRRPSDRTARRRSPRACARAIVAAETDLDVVGMRTEREQIDGHRSLNLEGQQHVPGTPEMIAVP